MIAVTGEVAIFLWLPGMATLTRRSLASWDFRKMNLAGVQLFAVGAHLAAS